MAETCVKFKQIIIISKKLRIEYKNLFPIGPFLFNPFFTEIFYLKKLGSVRTIKKFAENIGSDGFV